MTSPDKVKEALNTLAQLPVDQHWFCPRDGSDEQGLFYDDDVRESPPAADDLLAKQRKKRVEKANGIHATFNDAVGILVFNNVESAQTWLKEQLANQLKRCDICIREYHRGRKAFIEKIQRSLDSEDISKFLSVFDTMNVARVESHIISIRRQLEALPIEKRHIRALDHDGQLSLLEAFHCAPYYRNEKKLAGDFSELLNTIETRKPLKFSSYAPGMFAFLLGDDANRRAWAIKALQRIKVKLNPAEFEFYVRDEINAVASMTQLLEPDIGLFSKLWNAFNLIVHKVDASQLAECLHISRGVLTEEEFQKGNLCYLALRHVTIDDNAVLRLFTTMAQVLRNAPEAFWSAVGVEQAALYIDRSFQNPAFDRLFSQATDKNDDTLLESLLGWVHPYHISLPASSECLDAWKSLLGNLAKFRARIMPSWKGGEDFIRNLIFNVLAMLLKTIDNTFRPERLHATTRCRGLTRQYVEEVMPLAKRNSQTLEIASDIIKNAISIDCKVLAHFGRSPRSIHDHDTELQDYQTIWHNVSRSLDYGNIVLADKLLNAIKPIALQNLFVAKDGLSKHEEQINAALNSKFPFLTEWVERISEFDVTDLKKLVGEPKTIICIALLLFSPNADVQSSSVELLKSLSETTNRRDALEYLFGHHFAIAVNAMSSALVRVSALRVFKSAETGLKPCTDMLKILCDPLNGLLRSRTLTEETAPLIETLWQSLWKFLRMIFSSTEGWSHMGFDRNILAEFCRNSMDFADDVFDQFGVVAGALSAVHVRKDDSKGPGHRLIKGPQEATDSIRKWLQLRDEFLVTKSVALVCKLLVRLQKLDVQLPEHSLSFIMKIVLDEERNTLSQQQKAELLRALETHSGIEMADAASMLSNRSMSRGVKEDKSPIHSKSLASKAKQTTTQTKLAPSSSSVTTTFDKLKSSGLPFKRETNVTQTSATPLAARRSTTTPPPSTDFKRKRDLEVAEKKRRDAEAAKRLRVTATSAGAGSALAGIGIQGKEHREPQKHSTTTVSSDDESSSDDSMDDLEDDLLDSQPDKAPGVAKSKHQNATKQAPRAPVKKQRVVRSAKDMKARLAPDLSKLHKTLLGWNLSQDGNFPPGFSANQFASVQNSFRDPHSYSRTFEPLLLLEAWSGFLKAKDETIGKPYAIKIVTRSTIDSFFEVSSVMPMENAKDVAEGDLIVLATTNTSSPLWSNPHCLSRVARVSKKKGNLEIIYKTVPNSPIGGNLTPETNIFGLKITSLIPLEREYGALMGLPYYDLCSEITLAKTSPILEYSDATTNPISEIYGINTAQAKAVKCALDNDAFTLIQGPPGSGKTKTIVAIVGAILSNTLKSRTGVVIKEPNQLVQNQTNGGLPKKLLVCAPSNAAVDELVMRFKEGVVTLSGSHEPVNVVRIGRTDVINSKVHDVTLEELVNKRLNIKPENSTERAETQKAMQEHQLVSEQLRSARTQLDEAESKGGPTKEMTENFETLRRKKAQLGQKIESLKDRESTQSRQAEIDKKKAQQQVLNEAHVLCATLSGSGHDMFLGLNIEFETVIIDEAAQCVELSALIPLKYGCAKCILVGDPQQLPPTVFSKDAAGFKYEQSLFVRMQQNQPEEVHLLDTQYRMHPEISAFPSRLFYKSRLRDGKDMAALRKRAWHQSAIFTPLRFFDVEGLESNMANSRSLVNRAEIAVAIQLYTRFIRDFPACDKPGLVGIITPYKLQLRELKNAFKSEFGTRILDHIEFNTTDAFQGREREIIIFSCVRASSSGGIGFLQDIRRMNVGLTRAKSSLWVLGSSRSLVKGEFWAQLLKYAKEKDRYTAGDISSILAKSSRSLPNGRSSSFNVDIDPSDTAMDVDEELTSVTMEDVSMKEASDSEPSGSSRAGSQNQPQRVPAAKQTNSIARSSSGRLEKDKRPVEQEQTSTSKPNFRPKPSKAEANVFIKKKPKPPRG